MSVAGASPGPAEAIGGDAHDHGEATPARVVLHTAGLAAMSFLMSANGLALPQLFYQRHHPHDKVLLLAACLFVGTCGSIAGVVASRRGSAQPKVVVAALAATLAAEGALLFVTGARVYAALNAAAQMGANYLMNHLDHAALARAGDRHRRLHDGASTAVRLAAMLAAPALFTAIYPHRTAMLAVLAGAGAAAIAGAVSLGKGSPAEPGRGAPPEAGTRPIDAADALLFGFAVCVYVALYLLAANVIYLLRDVVGLPDAERRGGGAIVTVFAAALLANAGSAALGGRGRRLGLAALAAPLLPISAAAAALASGAVTSYRVLLAGCAVVGACYGVFLAELRDRASRGAHEGRAGLLTLFNNLANISSLIAFAMMIALAAAHRGATARTYGLLLSIVAALPWAGLPLLFASNARARRAA